MMIMAAHEARFILCESYLEGISSLPCRTESFCCLLGLFSMTPESRIDGGRDYCVAKKNKE